MTTSDKALVRQGMDLIDRMEADELNELVDYIREVFKSKRAMDRARAFTDFQVGDKVQLQKLKPQYLNGLTGEITERLQTRFVITLDRGPIKKFRSGTVRVSPVALTKIGDN